MNGVRTQPKARLAMVEGGALLGDLDHAACPFGLATRAISGLRNTLVRHWRSLELNWRLDEAIRLR